MGVKKRKVEVVVISDVHLGTYGCHAKELLRYLKSIKPKKIILNGDIIDIWQFSKSYWPKAHMQVVKYLTGLIAKGVKVQYITGNHDEMLRKFVGFKMGSFTIQNKLLLELDGRQAWIFHGDVFDVTMQHSRWLAKLGAVGYDLLILINRFVNFFSVKLNGNKISLSRSIKNRVKSAVAFINNFEETAANIAIDNGYDYVVCGHIHHPEIKRISTDIGSVTYLNSGDWIENLTALEYYGGQWHLYRYHDDATLAYQEEELPDTASEVLNYPELMQNLMQEFKLKGA
ncbi:UDP-2,3-diacylglucosamine diphosphatase [Adhaeribacter radiodurans]|uniref:UDP-2,3-diacylglucosamine diphosphatase n=1 Tax=Adhaeribacter radiodurans TaxID=2745197 RepID=A0A7L7LES7_9BACT|nr:UDP-2,3-diacylglucosamine diphosphatase [Adhaeribacter radiodurans]QMU31184.1 UDP-2,3-diacylglucosamine diphosphatase [Adhaeribacter radiodurans]